MKDEDYQHTVEELRHRVLLLERRQKIGFSTVVVVVLGMFVFLGWKVQAPNRPETLRLRQLAIVDEKGTERVVLGSPVPDPMMGGVRQKRRSPATGMIINDATGDERGGFSVLDDGSLVSCFDTKGGEGTCMFVLPSGARGFLVNGEKGTERTMLGLTSADGSPFTAANSPQHAGLVVRDSKGAVRFWMGIAPDDSAFFHGQDRSGQRSEK